LRTNKNSTNVAGTSYQTEANIQINFYWLIFPVALWVMITGFFCATILQTITLPSWKASALALLWCREEGDNQLSTPETIEERGRKTNIRLKAFEETWRLLETEVPRKLD
jgi:type VI protein secretion system component VasK